LNLNVPVDGTGTPAVDMTTWCNGDGGVDLRTWPTYDVELLISKWGLAERACYVGIDLAWTTDFTAMTCLFPPTSDDERWRILSFAWIPEDRIEFIARQTRAPIEDWVRRGFIQTVPGPKMETLVVEAKIKWADEMFGVREVTYDPWGGMTRSAEVLAGDGMVCVEVKQHIQKLTAATKEFLALNVAGALMHGNHPVMNWHVSCLALDGDKNDNVKPVKPKRDTSSKRIDLVSSAINAMSRAMLMTTPSPQEIEVW
jgi:phage terminase large subunit-like protein